VLLVGSSTTENREVKAFVSHGRTLPRSGSRLPVTHTGCTNPPKPKLLDQVRSALRARHYSPRTEQTYCQWIKRFVFFHKLRHPAEMGEAELNA
jgi:hypothetical protein